MEELQSIDFSKDDFAENVVIESNDKKITIQRRERAENFHMYSIDININRF